MKYEIQEQSSVQTTIRVEIPSSDLEDKKKELFRKYSKQIVIPGFRRGKAPLTMLKRRIGKEIEQEAIGALVEPSYKKLLDEITFNPLDQPTIDIGDYEKDNPLSYTVVFETYPVFDLQHYKDYDFTKWKVIVDDKMVEVELTRIRNEHPVYKSVERSAGEGDFVEFDALPESDEFAYDERVNFKIKVESDGLDSRYFYHLNGASVGDDKKFELFFDNSRPNELQGKTLLCDVTIIDVQECIVPELSDEFVANLEMTESKTVEAYKAEIEENIEKVFDDSNQRYLINQLVDKLIEDNPFDAHEKLVERQLDSMVANYKQELSLKNEELTQPAYEEFILKSKPVAIRTVKATFIFEKLKEVFDIKVSEEEVFDEIREKFGRGSENLDEFDPKIIDYFKNAARSRLEQERTETNLLSVQNIETKSISPEEWKDILSEDDPKTNEQEREEVEETETTEIAQ